MKIALLGASGRIGQRITLEALVRGHEVKAMVRNPERFPIAHPRLDEIEQPRFIRQRFTAVSLEK